MRNWVDLHKNPYESLGVGGRRAITIETRICNQLHNWRLNIFLSFVVTKMSWFRDGYRFTPKVLKVHRYNKKTCFEG